MEGDWLDLLLTGLLWLVVMLFASLVIFGAISVAAM